MIDTDMEYPAMARVRQRLDCRRVENIGQTVAAELRRIGIAERIQPGDSVAITAGSRGIAAIVEVLQAVAAYLKNCGAMPFLIPAMGSHGGASAQGQSALLNSLGINERSVGCAIRSTMETVEIGRSSLGLPVHLDRYAHEARHIVVVNRIKPHTKFEGPIESGLAKMMAIGLGKHEGARRCHQAAVRFGMGETIESAANAILQTAPVLCGLGIVENACKQAALIRAALPENLLEEERKLLAEAREKMARIPFDEIDLLIVDEMGKNISGTGMDPNVTGVNRDILGTFRCGPKTRRLFVRDLTDETGGNALGIGLADFATTRLVKKIDYQKTVVNCIAGISPEKGAVPIHFETDRECVAAAIHCLGLPDAGRIRVVRIKNTQALEILHLSSAYLSEIDANPRLERIDRQFAPMAFAKDGNLASPFA